MGYARARGYGKLCKRGGKREKRNVEEYKDQCWTATLLLVQLEDRK